MATSLAPLPPPPERRRPPQTLSGSLGQLSLADLLQTAEANRRSGSIQIESAGRSGILWLRDGRLAEAEIAGGPRGEEALFQMVFWEEGSFEAEFKPVALTALIAEPISGLLLEAMRRHDEARRDEPPPHAALADPPPPPPRHLLAAHRALMLLNVAAAYAADHLERELLARRLEETRREVLAGAPELAAFRVEPTGLVVLPPDGPPLPDAEATVRAASRWLLALFGRLERALPGRFPLRRLRQISEAVQDDLEGLGFYRELGLADTP